MDTKEIKYKICANHEQTYCMECQTKGLYCTHSVIRVQCKDCWNKPYVAPPLDEYYKLLTRDARGLDW